MKIEHFYYDEQEKWFAQMKAAMEKHDAELSKEERTLEQKKSERYGVAKHHSEC